MRLAICGHGRHGKGTVAAWLRDNTDLRYVKSTSDAAADLVYSHMRDRYRDAAECWRDRHNHRGEWAQIIWRHNQPDGTTLYEEMAAENDIIEGIRRPSELLACLTSRIVEAAIWIDASRRVGPDPTCEIIASNCNLTIDNNGPWSSTAAQLRELCDTLAIPTRRAKEAA